MRRVLLALAVLVVAAPFAEAYDTLKTSGAKPLRWRTATFPVPYTLNQAGSEGTPLAQVQQAVRASFQTWEDVPTASITFRYAGNTSQATMRNDGVNLIRWFETDFPFDNNSLAVTVNTFNDVTGDILDADMHMNGSFAWSTSESSQLFDIQNVVTHEAGHVLGLAHTSVRDATMFPDARPGETSKRTLHQDDVDGVSFLYPASGGGGGSQPPPADPGDVDSSGRVDGQDLIFIGTAFGSTRGQAAYLRAADLDRDGDVDGEDLAIIAEHFGTIY